MVIKICHLLQKMKNGKYGKYNEIWEVIRKLLKVKYSSDPIRDW